MAFIRYRPSVDLDPGERVPDPDNIIQIHAILRQILTTEPMSGEARNLLIDGVLSAPSSTGWLMDSA